MIIEIYVTYKKKNEKELITQHSAGVDVKNGQHHFEAVFLDAKPQKIASPSLEEMGFFF